MYYAHTVTHKQNKNKSHLNIKKQQQSHTQQTIGGVCVYLRVLVCVPQFAEISTAFKMFSNASNITPALQISSSQAA